MDTNNKNNNSVITTGEWFITKVLMLIPIINIILLIIWAFNKKENLNKANWARATLIVYVIRLCFALIIILTFLSFFISLFNF